MEACLHDWLLRFDTGLAWCNGVTGRIGSRSAGRPREAASGQKTANHRR